LTQPINCDGKWFIVNVSLMKKSLHIAGNGTDRANGLFRFDALSRREYEVMLLAAKGLSNKAIARQLNLTEGTIKLHLHKVYDKLGVQSRFSLTALTMKLAKD